jgi:hypothetical protein
MTKILFLLAFFSFSGLAIAQSESANRQTAASPKATEAGKKISISSASRRSSMPGVGNSNAKIEGDGSSKHAHDNPKGTGVSPLNRPDGRVPKSRPVGPITRPSGIPGGQPVTLPGNRPSGPRNRPGGG